MCVCVCVCVYIIYQVSCVWTPDPCKLYYSNYRVMCVVQDAKFGVICYKAICNKYRAEKPGSRIWEGKDFQEQNGCQRPWANG